MERWSRAAMIAALREDYARLGRAPTADGDWKYADPDRPTGCTVRRRFGSWNAALVEAGLPLNRPGKPIYWTKDRVAEVMLDWLFTHGRWPLLSDWHHAHPDGYYPSHYQVRRLFGGWFRAQKYAGRALTPGQKRRARLDQPTKEAHYGKRTTLG